MLNIYNNKYEGIMLDKILKIIQDKPKHYAKIIGHDPSLKSWVNDHSITKNKQLAAQIYSAISNTTDLCQHGKNKRFVSINQGWGFCGAAKSCICANEHVSEKCRQASLHKNWDLIIEKRQNTNLQKYGHKNAAQSLAIKEKHRKFYKNEQNIKLTTEKHIKTMQERYNVDNPAQLETVKQKTKQTNLIKYGVENPQQNKSINARAQQTRKEKYHKRYLIETSYGKMQEKYASLGYRLLTNQSDYTNWFH